MGIRFYCPNGHKLHVKSFQAGRKGICPYCGVTIDIPLTSTRGSKDDKCEAEDSGTPHHNSSSRNEPAGGSGINLNAIAPSSGGFSYPQAEQNFASKGMDKEIELSAPLDRNVSVPSMSITGAPAAGAATSTAVDPIKESPSSVWYVQPVTGGQYGPATGDIMQLWLDEGRVAEDSMVWREGWPDWKEAAKVFPQLAPPKPTLDFTANIESRSQNNAPVINNAPSINNATGNNTAPVNKNASGNKNVKTQKNESPLSPYLTVPNLIIAVQTVIILLLIIVVIVK